MKQAIFFLVCLVGFAIITTSVRGEEILLKNGNKIDYGATWEKDGVVWFNFYGYGLAGIDKAAVSELAEAPEMSTKDEESFSPENYEPIPQE